MPSRKYRRHRQKSRSWMGGMSNENASEPEPVPEPVPVPEPESNPEPEPEPIRTTLIGANVKARKANNPTLYADAAEGDEITPEMKTILRLSGGGRRRKTRKHRRSRKSRKSRRRN